RQPRAAPWTEEISSGSATRFPSAYSIATYSANEPQAVKPGVKLTSQTLVQPFRQGPHSPQPTAKGTVTRPPTLHRRTPEPTAATVPTISWPGTCGSDG